eukprot:4785726-Alexandrium_andersonii.AAC.1
MSASGRQREQGPDHAPRCGALQDPGIGQLVRWPAVRDAGCGRGCAGERRGSGPGGGPCQTRSGQGVQDPLLNWRT